MVIAAVPQHDGSSAVLSGRDDSLEVRVFDRMIFDFDREMLFTLLPRQSLRHGPGLQDPFHLKAEVVMQSTRVVFLNDETRCALDQLRQRLSAFRFGGHRKIPLLLVFG